MMLDSKSKKFWKHWCGWMEVPAMCFFGSLYLITHISKKFSRATTIVFCLIATIFAIIASVMIADGNSDGFYIAGCAIGTAALCLICFCVNVNSHFKCCKREY